MCMTLEEIVTCSQHLQEKVVNLLRASEASRRTELLFTKTYDGDWKLLLCYYNTLPKCFVFVDVIIFVFILAEHQDIECRQCLQDH
mmetsp:Transcript_32833/g.48413  ORF Transcript_32833/g.48413 Transcript_32833/m.48413 type:complete len:86 (-) Transcript_32833:1017-1274(-)